MVRFLLGFLFGLGIGTCAAIMAVPRLRNTWHQGVTDLIDETLATARQATEASEQELWSEFRTRIAKQA